MIVALVGTVGGAVLGEIVSIAGAVAIENRWYSSC